MRADTSSNRRLCCTGKRPRSCRAPDKPIMSSTSTSTSTITNSSSRHCRLSRTRTSGNLIMRREDTPRSIINPNPNPNQTITTTNSSSSSNDDSKHRSLKQ